MVGRNSLYIPGWLRWLLGSITFLGLAILILSVVLGVRAGQQQLEVRSRQQIAISLQRALELQAEGKFEDAFSAYRSVLVLDPNNSAATEGVQALLAEGGQGRSTVAEGQSSTQVAATQSGNGSESAASEQPAQPVSASSAELALFDDAQSAFQAQEWQNVIDALTQLRATNPQYRQAEVTEFLYTAHYTMASELETRNDVDGAVEAYDAAIAVHPNPVGAEVGKELLNKYIEALTIDAADHWRLIATLTSIYQADRGYRDVSTRLQAAYVRHGDSLVSEQDWCLATEQYNKAIDIDITPGLMSKRNRYREQCETDGPKDDSIPNAPSVLAAGDQGSGSRLGDGTASDNSLSASDEIDLATNGSNNISAAGGASAAKTTVETASASTGNSVAALTTATARQAASTQRNAESDLATPSSISTGEIDARESNTGESNTEESGAEEEATAQPASVTAPTTAASGNILYAAQDLSDGRFRVFLQPVNGSGTASVVVDDGAQPAYRPDGTRVVYRNTRSDSIGLTAHDPGSGLYLRFTDFGEDGFPHWSPDGNRVVFASTRESDRRWRIYIAWAEESGVATNHSFGETPSWHPTQDLIVYRGCDERGNACGLWTMDGNGGSRRSITQVVQDSHPTWSPDGTSIVFMSSGRDGNPELYRLATSSGTVTQMTSSPGIDGIPTISPSGDWVAFLSDRNGWGIWIIPISGGEAQLVAPLAGQPGEWQAQQLQWVQ